MIDIKDFLYIEWVITYQCNFHCSYCFFNGNLSKKAYMFKNRGPKLPKNIIEKGLFNLAYKINAFQKADSFENYKLDEWKKLFLELSKYRKKLYLSFTGGEPLIYYKKINELLNEITSYFEKIVIRIDSNGSIIPKFDKKEIITYNVSYHPTQIEKETLLNNLDKIRNNGKVLMVNRVVTCDDNLDIVLKEVQEFKDRGYYLNISPANFKVDCFNEQEIEILKKLKHPDDYNSTINHINIGKKCVFPMFGIQLLPNGFTWISPCDNRTINLMKNPSLLSQLLHKKPLICPTECSCFHQYYWSVKNYTNYNIMQEYVDRNIKYRESVL